MDTKVSGIIESWPENAFFTSTIFNLPVLILSKWNLNSQTKDQLRNSYISILDEQDIGVITSAKQTHVYFQHIDKTYDYRPHRGLLSKLASSSYRLGNSDRVEVLLHFSPKEISNLFTYIANIQQDRHAVLGPCWPFSLIDPDFTVRSHLTRGKLHDNQLLNVQEKQNCLTWFTTAPIGAHGEPIHELLGMNGEQIKGEAHAYYVEFYRFLLSNLCPRARVSGLVYWSNDPLDITIEKLLAAPERLLNFYDPKPKNRSQSSSSVNISSPLE